MIYLQVFTARTCETYDIDYLCCDLQRQISASVVFDRNTFAIAICDSTIDHRSVMRKLSDTYSFDIYGTTALAFMDQLSSEATSVSLMIITGGEELKCAAVLSDSFSANNAEQYIFSAYTAACEQIEGDPAVIISMIPFCTDITPELTVRIIDRISNSRPLYGAVSSCDLSTNGSGVYFNGEFYRDRIVIGLLGGNVRPQFTFASIFPKPSTHSAVITNSKNSTVYSVDGESFVNYMKRCGLMVKNNDTSESFLATYATTPTIIYEDGKRNYTVRNIVGIDYTNGAVTFSGEMPVGKLVSVAVAKREDVVSSSTLCFDQMAQKIEDASADGYRYSALLAASCGSRYLIMTGDTSIEASCIINSPALDSLAFCGFYAMGEFCPISVADGTADNRPHHGTISLMAF